MMTTPAEYLAQIDAVCEQARAACAEAARHRAHAADAHLCGDQTAFEQHVDRWEAAMQYAREQLEHGGELQRRLETEHPITDEETNTMSNLEAPGYLEHAQHTVCSECRMCVTCADCICKSRLHHDDQVESTDTAQTLAERACDLTDAILEFSGHHPRTLADKIANAIGALIAVAIGISIGIIVIALAARAAFSVLGIDIQ